MSCPCCISTDTNAEKQAAARTSSIASSSIDKPLVDNINRDSTGRNKHSVDRYSSTKADTKVDNEHELSKIRWSYWDDNASNSQRLDTQKGSKIKAAQDVSAAEAKVNERNTRTDEDEAKSSLHDDSLIRVIESSYSHKQENVNKSTSSRHIHVEAKSLLKR